MRKPKNLFLTKTLASLITLGVVVLLVGADDENEPANIPSNYSNDLLDIPSNYEKG